MLYSDSVGHQLSHYIKFIANFSELMGNSDYSVYGAVTSIAVETGMKGPLQRC